MNTCKVEFAAQGWETPAPGVRVKVFRKAGTQVRLVEFAQEFVEADWCLRGHAGYVLDGRIAVDFGGGDVEVFGPGDGLIIPPGGEHKHKARALTGTVTVVLIEAADEADTPPHAADETKDT